MPTDIGAYLAGAFLEFCCDCDVVSYDHALIKEQGDIDVLGLNLAGRAAFAVESKTHISGLGGYGGHPGPKLRDQVLRAQRFLNSALPDWNYRYAIWSPHVTPKMEAQVRSALNSPGLPPVDLVINAEFAERVTTLAGIARTDRKFRANPAFRLLQVLARSSRHGFEL